MIRLLLSITLAAVLLGAVLAWVGADATLAALREVSWPWLAAVVVVQLFVQLLKARRWATVLHSAAGTRPRRVFTAQCIGSAANILLPARLGELARAQVLSRANPVSRSLALTTLAVAQLADLLLLGGLLFVASCLVATNALFDRRVLALLTVLAGLCAGILIVIQRRPERAAQWLTRLTALLPGPVRNAVAYYLTQFTSGLTILGHRRAAILLTLQTALIWTLEIASVVAALRAFDIPATFLMATVVTVTANLAFALPLTPANLGTGQVLGVLVLGLFHVPSEQACAFSLGYQAAGATLTLALGALALLHAGLRPAALVQPPTDEPIANPPTQELSDVADGSLPRPQGPVSPARIGSAPRAAAGVRELHVCARADRPGF